jgi:hypothetical protein
LDTVGDLAYSAASLRISARILTLIQEFTSGCESICAAIEIKLERDRVSTFSHSGGA